LHKIIERLEVALVSSPKTLCVNPKTITTSYMASLQGEQQPNHAIICFKLPQAFASLGLAQVGKWENA
jgi:hypothetical protein